jgi:uncharacterized SAM-binding protein YcdF (DUF218 family)
MIAAAAAHHWRYELLRLLGRSIVKSDVPQVADLILVLGGDFYGPRVVRAADLAMQGFAPYVLISGPPYAEGYECDRAIEFLVKHGYPRHLFLCYRHHASSTIEEVVLLRPEIRRLNPKRIILVTSNYHSLRAYLLFRLKMPFWSFQMVAANDSHFDPEHWWEYASQTKFWKHEVLSLGWNVLIGQWFYW